MISHQTTPEPALLVYPDPARLKRIMVGFGLFSLLLLVPVILVFAAFGPMLGTLTIILVALSLLAVLYSTYRNWKDAQQRPRPSLYVNRAGITVITSPSRASYVPWGQVKGFVILKFLGLQGQLRIFVRSRKAITVPAPATKPATTGGGGRFLAITRQMSPVPFTALFREINAYRPAAPSKAASS